MVFLLMKDIISILRILVQRPTLWVSLSLKNKNKAQVPGEVTAKSQLGENFVGFPWIFSMMVKAIAKDKVRGTDRNLWNPPVS